MSFHAAAPTTRPTRLRNSVHHGTAIEVTIKRLLPNHDMKRHAATPAFIYDFPAYCMCDVYEDTVGAGCFPQYSASHPAPGKTTYPHSQSPRTTAPRHRARYAMDLAMDLPEQPPWAHVAQTYAWVLDQSFAEMARKNEETVCWIMEQQRRDVLRAVDATREAMAYARNVAAGVQASARDTARGYRLEEIWRTPVDARWRRDAEEAVQEELRRLRQARQNTERCRDAYEKRKTEEMEAERRRTEAMRKSREKRKQAERQLFASYESQWASIASASEETRKPLAFHSIPWPVFVQPHSLEDITPARVASFVLSPSHSEGQPRKDRVKAALRRWHPDRFGRWQAMVEECDRENVEEGAGIVVRCLSNLLERADETP